MEQCRFININEAYGELNKLKCSRCCATEKWWTAKFSDICSRKAPECEDTHEFYKSTYNLLGPEAAKHAYRKFCKHGWLLRQ